VVRLRHAHRDLRSADPTHNTVAAIGIRRTALTSASPGR
jgi:hypothetical protein